MTMPDERFRALGEMRRLLLEIADPGLHMSAFNLQLPNGLSSCAKSLLGYYPTFAQMADESVSKISQQEWLKGYWPDSHLTRKFGLVLRTKKRFDGLHDSREFLTAVLEDSAGDVSGKGDGVLRSIRFVLRHFPAAWQLNTAAKSPQPLSQWIGFHALPDWWVDSPAVPLLEECFRSWAADAVYQ